MDDLILILISQFASGLTRSMILFIIASGLTLIVGVLGIVNFAHGALYMVGAYLIYTSMTYLFGSSFLGFIASMAIAVVVMAVISVLIERTLLKRIYYAGGVAALLLTYGLSLMIFDAILFIWGPATKVVPRPDGLGGAILFSGVVVPSYNVFLIISGVLVAIGLWILTQRTNFGKKARAVSADPETSRALGVNVDTVYIIIFALGGAMAGLGGALAGPLGSICPAMGESIIIEAFIVVIIGGLGSLLGAFIGACIVGMTESFVIFFIPELGMIAIFIIMVIILSTRPFGLLGNIYGPLSR